jgi:hypothetical protein
MALPDLVVDGEWMRLYEAPDVANASFNSTSTAQSSVAPNSARRSRLSFASIRQSLSSPKASVGGAWADRFVWLTGRALCHAEAEPEHTAHSPHRTRGVTSVDGCDIAAVEPVKSKDAKALGAPEESLHACFRIRLHPHVSSMALVFAASAAPERTAWIDALQTLRARSDAMANGAATTSELTEDEIAQLGMLQHAEVDRRIRIENLEVEDWNEVMHSDLATGVAWAFPSLPAATDAGHLGPSPAGASAGSDGRVRGVGAVDTTSPGGDSTASAAGHALEDSARETGGSFDSDPRESETQLPQRHRASSRVDVPGDTEPASLPDGAPPFPAMEPASPTDEPSVDMGTMSRADAAAIQASEDRARDALSTAEAAQRRSLASGEWIFEHGLWTSRLALRCVDAMNAVAASFLLLTLEASARRGSLVEEQTSRLEIQHAYSLCRLQQMETHRRVAYCDGFALIRCEMACEHLKTLEASARRGWALQEWAAHFEIQHAHGICRVQHREAASRAARRHEFALRRREMMAEALTTFAGNTYHGGLITHEKVLAQLSLQYREGLLRTHSAASESSERASLAKLRRDTLPSPRSSASPHVSSAAVPGGFATARALDRPPGVGRDDPVAALTKSAAVNKTTRSSTPPKTATATTKDENDEDHHVGMVTAVPASRMAPLGRDGLAYSDDDDDDGAAPNIAAHSAKAQPQAATHSPANNLSNVRFSRRHSATIVSHTASSPETSVLATPQTSQSRFVNSLAANPHAGAIVVDTTPATSIRNIGEDLMLTPLVPAGDPMYTPQPLDEDLLGEASTRVAYSNSAGLFPPSGMLNGDSGVMRHTPPFERTSPPTQDTPRLPPARRCRAPRRFYTRTVSRRRHPRRPCRREQPSPRSHDR